LADYKDNVLKLRQEVQEAVTLGTINTELYGQQMIQLLNSCEGVKQKAQAEIERLSGQIGECRGTVKAAEMMAGLLIETVAAYNRQEHKRIEEERRVAAERLERAASAPQSGEPETPSLTEEEEETSERPTKPPEKGKRGKRA